jgi:hypothetical protein
MQTIKQSVFHAMKQEVHDVIIFIEWLSNSYAQTKMQIHLK